MISKDKMMSKKYAVWTEIELIDESKDTYEDMQYPVKVQEFDTLEEAKSFQNNLYEEYNGKPIDWRNKKNA